MCISTLIRYQRPYGCCVSHVAYRKLFSDWKYLKKIIDKKDISEDLWHFSLSSRPCAFNSLSKYNQVCLATWVGAQQNFWKKNTQHRHLMCVCVLTVDMLILGILLTNDCYWLSESLVSKTHKVTSIPKERSVGRCSLTEMLCVRNFFYNFISSA